MDLIWEDDMAWWSLAVSCCQIKEGWEILDHLRFGEAQGSSKLQHCQSSFLFKNVTCCCTTQKVISILSGAKKDLKNIPSRTLFAIISVKSVRQPLRSAVLES